jgi:hypothetical protein
MRRKLLKGGVSAWFFEPPTWAREAECPVKCEPLGTDFEAAATRVEGLLYPQFRAWCVGRKIPDDFRVDPRHGTLAWLNETYFRSRAFEKVADRTKPTYRKMLSGIERLKIKGGGTLGEMPVARITPRLADAAYDKILKGPKGKRYRTANYTADIARRAWDVVQRLYLDTVPEKNPFKGIVRERRTMAKKHATLAEVQSLADALERNAHPALAVAALICFWWLQRPENVLGGHITWKDYRPADHPGHVRIFHHKTDEPVWLPLSDEAGPFYPDLEARIARLRRLGTPMVLNENERGSDRGYSLSYARRRVREARRSAGLPEHITLDACRHGGLTALGDAGATAFEIRAMSAHKTLSSVQGYVKPTDTQMLSGSRKRRALTIGTKSEDLSE